MVTAAFRYCLGRTTYIVPACVDWLLNLWKHLSPTTQKLIRKEIREAIARKAAGWDMDEEQWTRLLNITEENKNNG